MVLTRERTITVPGGHWSVDSFIAISNWWRGGIQLIATAIATILNLVGTAGHANMGPMRPRTYDLRRFQGPRTYVLRRLQGCRHVLARAGT